MLTEDEYNNAVEEIWQLMDSNLGTPECDRLSKLSELASEYQRAHFAIKKPGIIAMARYHFERLLGLL